jgi:hypothetical protein
MRSQINFWKTFGLLIFTESNVPHIIKNIICQITCPSRKKQ